MQRPVLVGRNYGGGGRQGKFSRANQVSVFKDVPPPATLEERDEKSRSRFFFYFIIDLKIISLIFLDEINRKPG